MKANASVDISCFDCQFIRRMKSGKDWCINDKSWLVGWITDAKNQVCGHHISANTANNQPTLTKEVK